MNKPKRTYEDMLKDVVATLKEQGVDVTGDMLQESFDQFINKAVEIANKKRPDKGDATK